MYEKIDYGEPFSLNTFKREIILELGEEFWDELVKGIELPDIETEGCAGCRRMALFMDRLNERVDKETLKQILKRVRHGLHPSKATWAREDFLKIGDLDEYIRVSIEDGIKNFTRLYEEKKDFYGQTITKEALDFVKNHTACLSARREGNKLYIYAFPADMDAYVREKDERMKRYHACHCPFAKESILSDKPVSNVLCNCSLGHVANCWEAIFDRVLEGEVVSSVLGGDLLCEYCITLPEDVMRDYVKPEQR